MEKMFKYVNRRFQGDYECPAITNQRDYANMVSMVITEFNFGGEIVELDMDAMTMKIVTGCFGSVDHEWISTNNREAFVKLVETCQLYYQARRAIPLEKKLEYICNVSRGRVLYIANAHGFLANGMMFAQTMIVPAICLGPFFTDEQIKQIIESPFLFDFKEKKTYQHYCDVQLAWLLNEAFYSGNSPEDIAQFVDDLYVPVVYTPKKERPNVTIAN